MNQDRFDIFLSRRGSVAALAQEIADLLNRNGYTVIVQDYDIPLTANFVERMHEAIKGSRDLVVLFTQDYEQSPFTRKEFTSFEADRATDQTQERRIIVLRCEDVPLRGLLAANVYQDLVGISDPKERAEKVLAAIRGEAQAPRPTLRPFIGIPPRLANFTGRAEALDRLDGILIGGKVATVTQAAGSRTEVGRAAVHGLGGVGKSSLAAEYAHRYRDLYAGVLWCPAETRFGLVNALAELAGLLGIGAEGAEPEARAKSALDRLTTLRANWLLVYDNVTAPEDIADLMPRDGARLLVTSRFPDWTGWAEEVALDAMPVPEAVAFLCGRAGRDDPDGATALATALGGLPLALDHAGAFCRRTQTSFRDYAARVGTMLPAVPRGVAYPRSVAATFELAIAEATGQTPAARPMLDFIAQCAPERVPLALAEGAFDDPGEASQALLALADTSLLRNDPFPDGMPAVSMHRLVQAVARATASEAATLTARRRLLSQLEARTPYFNGEDIDTYSPVAAFLPHRLALYEFSFADDADDLKRLNLVGGAASLLHIFEKDGRDIEILRNLYRYALERYGLLDATVLKVFGNLIHALPFQNREDMYALVDERITLIEQMPAPIELERLEGSAYSTHMMKFTDRGDFSERLAAIYERDLEASQQRLGIRSPIYIDIVRNIYYMTRKSDDEYVKIKFIEIIDSLKENGETIDNSNIVVDLQGNIDRIENKSADTRDKHIRNKKNILEHENTTLEDKLKILKEIFPTLLMSGKFVESKKYMDELERIAEDRGDELFSNWYREKIDLEFKTFLEIKNLYDEKIEKLYIGIKYNNEKVKESTYNSIIYQLNLAAESYLRHAFIIEARELLKRAKYINENNAKDNQPWIDALLIDIIIEIGSNEEMKKLSEEMTYGEKSNFDIYMKSNRIAKIYQICGDVDQAELHLKAGKEASERHAAHFGVAGDSSHVDIYVADIALLRGNATEALDILARMAKMDGDCSPANRKVLTKMSEAAETSGDMALAEKLHTRIHEIYQEGHGPDSIWTATHLAEFGAFHQRRGDLEKARSLNQRALAAATAAEGPDAPLTARIRVATAELLLAEGRPGEARAEAAQAHEVLLATAGPHNRFTQRAQTILQIGMN